MLELHNIGGFTDPCQACPLVASTRQHGHQIQACYSAPLSTSMDAVTSQLRHRLVSTGLLAKTHTLTFLPCPALPCPACHSIGIGLSLGVVQAALLKPPGWFRPHVILCTGLGVCSCMPACLSSHAHMLPPHLSCLSRAHMFAV